MGLTKCQHGEDLISSSATWVSESAGDEARLCGTSEEACDDFFARKSMARILDDQEVRRSRGFEM